MLELGYPIHNTLCMRFFWKSFVFQPNRHTQYIDTQWSFRYSIPSFTKNIYIYLRAENIVYIKGKTFFFVLCLVAKKFHWRFPRVNRMQMGDKRRPPGTLIWLKETKMYYISTDRLNSQSVTECKLLFTSPERENGI